MMAGHESLAYMFSWSLNILARRYDIQAKVRDELVTLSNDCSFAALDKVPYLTTLSKNVFDFIRRVFYAPFFFQLKGVCRRYRHRDIHIRSILYLTWFVSVCSQFAHMGR
jgi:hypothetical protein